MTAANKTVSIQAPDMDYIANICDKKTFLAQILSDPKGIMDCDAIYVV